MKLRRVIPLIALMLTAAAVLVTASLVGEFGLDLAAMDRSVAPGDDFFRYVNGGWLKNTQIPRDAARFAEFGRLADVNASRNREHPGEGGGARRRRPKRRKVGDFYASLIDEASREAAGTRALKPELDRIAAIATPADLARAIAQVIATGCGRCRAAPRRCRRRRSTAASPSTSRIRRGICPRSARAASACPTATTYLVDDPAFVKARDGLQGAPRPHVRAGRNVRRAGARRARVRARRAARQGSLDAGGAARPGKDLQPHDAARS